MPRSKDNSQLPLAEIPEELEQAELAALLDYLRENASLYTISELKEQALGAGYRDSVVERAIEEFAKEPRPAPEPGKRAEQLPPVPAPPLPKVAAFLVHLAHELQSKKPTPYRAGRMPPWLILLIVALNAVVLALAFNGFPDLAFRFFLGEAIVGMFLKRLQLVHFGRPRPPLPQQEKLAPQVQSEPGRTAVPTLPHEAPAEKTIPQRDRKKGRGKAPGRH
jgi:hypothetical protein